MTKPWPENPYLKGNYAPLLMEADAPDLEVLGESQIQGLERIVLLALVAPEDIAADGAAADAA